MKLSVILAFVWLVFKVVLLQLGYNQDKYGVMLNLFFIILIIFIAVRNSVGERSLIPLVKSAMRPAAVYVIAVCACIFIYYQFLDPGYLSGALENVVSDERNKIEMMGGFEEYKGETEGVTSDSLEEHLALIRGSVGGAISIFTPFGRVSITLILLTFFAIFYSLFLVVIHLLALKYLKK